MLRIVSLPPREPRAEAWHLCFRRGFPDRHKMAAHPLSQAGRVQTSQRPQDASVQDGGGGPCAETLHSCSSHRRTPWDSWKLPRPQQGLGVCAKLLPLGPPLCDPMDCGPPDSVHGLLQARLLEWVTVPSSRGSSRPGDQTRVSYVSCGGRQVRHH